MRLVAAAALVLGLVAPGAAQNAALELRSGESLLEVEAEGVHLSRPDVMTIGAGVVTTGPTASEALRGNGELAGRLVEVVRARGVAARDVRTSELRVVPRFERRGREEDETGEPRIVGYVATSRLELRLRDLSGASGLLDALVQGGANRVDGPAFALSEERPARLAAQREAVRLAREEAENYAAALGMRISRVLRVSERGRGSGEGRNIVVTGSRTAGVPIEPGELSTSVTVWVDFALAPQ